ncbi:MAG TPA: beta-L-arabinofuranosidase domain-containing protein [Anaerolineales bacterium]|nr:beta-L-arabinofuranosidase domain-containing protein [Anaerolineales bacterium]
MNSSRLPGFRFADRFWAPRLEALRLVTLPGQWESMESTGRIDNFRAAAGRIDKPHQGFVFNDSDVYKWLEAAARAGPHPAYRDRMAELVELIAAAQDPDGYLNTAFMGENAAERWSNIRDRHELYCAGHLIEAALVLSEGDDDRLMSVARRLADLICSLFGPEENGKRPAVPGHQEIEIALIALYRSTRETRYLEQARYFVDARGRGLIGASAYHQDHKPFRELDRMTGHAVRALYLNVAAADLFIETGEPALLETLERLWERLYSRQVYLTGGLGARHSGESFGDDYELPNAAAYSETCAAVASILWNRRMLVITGEARYADAIETALYNAALSGISLAGDRYFYTNPLASEGAHRRAAYFSCACCPPNIARLLAALPGYFVSGADGAVRVDLYAAGSARVEVNGREIELKVETDYPWDGRVRIVMETAGSYRLQLRVPGWVEGVQVEVNGREGEWADGRMGDRASGPGYLRIERGWSAGDVVGLDFPMPPRWVAAHPRVVENVGRVALMRGPLVYCLESSAPHPEHLRIAIDGVVESMDINGMVGLRFEAEHAPPGPGWEGSLYRRARAGDPGGSPVRVIAIPYFAWANGEAGPMRVWLRRGTH